MNTEKIEAALQLIREAVGTGAAIALVVQCDDSRRLWSNLDPPDCRELLREVIATEDGPVTLVEEPT